MFSTAFRIGLRHFSSAAADASPVTVGIIGLGNVGNALSKNLAKSQTHRLATVFDTDVSKSDFLAPDIIRAKSAKEVAERSDITITALPIPAIVKEVMEGQDGVLAGLTAGKTWIDHTTTDYEQTLRLSKIVESQGAFPLEAPVTGGITLLKQGKMTVLVGGNHDTFQRCKPLLAMSCKNVLYMGEMGSATITKVISNMLAGANTVLMGEAIMMAKRSGVDLKSFFEGIRLSAGNSYVWETEAPLVFNGSFDPDFTIKLHCKDYSLGSQIAEKYRAPIPVMGLIEHIYKSAKFKYGDEVGSSYPAKLLQDSLGESLQVEGFDDWMYSIEMVEGGSIGVVQTKKKGEPKN